ncbi:hypothetical protein D9M68_979680 [compost metagenome]
MLKFAILANDRALAVSLDFVGAAERSDQLVGQLGAQSAQLPHEGQQIIDVLARIGVFHNRRRNGDLQWRSRYRPAFVQHLLNVEFEFADLHQ